MSNVEPDKAMAVAIAKDVLSQLDTWGPSIRVRSRTGYFRSDYAVSPDKMDGDLRDILPNMLATQGCSVCALGAAFLSRARLFDDVPIKTLDIWQDLTNSEITVNGEQLYLSLGPAFSLDTLWHIESAFEQAVFGPRSTTKIKAKYFGLRFENPRERLQAIMLNIIENGGEFLPPASEGQPN